MFMVLVCYIGTGIRCIWFYSFAVSVNVNFIGCMFKVFSIQCIVQADIRLFINSVNSRHGLDESLDSGSFFS